MPIIEKLRDEAEKHIAGVLILLVTSASAGLLYIADVILPQELVKWLGWPLLARVLLGLTLVSIFLSAWIIYLKKTPERIFDEQLGAYKNKNTGIYYCAKCETTPLKIEKAGHYCAKCHLLYQTQNQKDEIARLREAAQNKEDEIVRRINSGLIP